MLIRMRRLSPPRKKKPPSASPSDQLHYLPTIFHSYFYEKKRKRKILKERADMMGLDCISIYILYYKAAEKFRIRFTCHHQRLHTARRPRSTG